MRLTGKMGLIENIGNLFRGKKLSEGPGTLPGMSAGSQPQIMNTATSINTAVNQVQPTYLPPLPTTDGQFPRYDGPPVEGYGVTGWQKFGGFSAEEYFAILQGRNADIRRNVPQRFAGLYSDNADVQQNQERAFLCKSSGQDAGSEKAGREIKLLPV
jgi:hypothetical protein